MYLTVSTNFSSSCAISCVAARGQIPLPRGSIIRFRLPEISIYGKSGNILQARGRSALSQLPVQLIKSIFSPPNVNPHLRIFAQMGLFSYITRSPGKRYIPVSSSPLQQLQSQSLPQSTGRGVTFSVSLYISE